MSVLGDSVSVVSSSVVDDNFEELLTCPICFETDKELRLFPACQHFACTECVVRIAAGGSTFRCPICREVVTLPVPVHRFAEQLRDENIQRIARRNNRRRHQDRTGRRNQIVVQQVAHSAPAQDTTAPSASTSTGGMISSFHQELLAVGPYVEFSNLDSGSADRTGRSNQSGRQQVTPSAPSLDPTAPSAPPTTSTGGVMSSFHQELLAVGPDVVVSNLDSSSAGNSCATGQPTVASNVLTQMKNIYQRMSQSRRRVVIVIAVVVPVTVVLYIIIVSSVLSSR